MEEFSNWLQCPETSRCRRPVLHGQFAGCWTVGDVNLWRPIRQHPSIRQYNVPHSDVIIHSSAIVLVTLHSLNTISDVPITDALQEQKPTALLRG